MYSKEQQLNHNRLREKKPNSFGKRRGIIKKKSIADKEDREFLDWFHHQPLFCFHCGTSNYIELHHVKRDSTCKKNHRQLIPLCNRHHTGSMEFSAHGTPKKFREKYSMELQKEEADKYYKYYLIHKGKNT